jgi:hypothetical protein
VGREENEKGKDPNAYSFFHFSPLVSPRPFFHRETVPFYRMRIRVPVEDPKITQCNDIPSTTRDV